jgi:hypothetical protein
VGSAFSISPSTYNNPATKPTRPKTAAATLSIPIFIVFSWAPLATTEVETTPLGFTELTPLEVPVVTTPLALLSTKLLVLFAVTGADVVDNDDVATTAAVEVEIFGLVVDALMDVVMDMGREVVPGEEGVDKVLE